MTEVRRTGPTIGGKDIGRIGYGMWSFTDPDLTHRTQLIETALEAGIVLFDTADVYGLDWGGTGFGTVESAFGEVLATKPEWRSRMVIATKGGIRPPTPYDSSPVWLRQACEDSLGRLRIDHIDLYQIHRPDTFTHPADVAATLDALHTEGKIGAVGVSNYTPAQTRALAAHLNAPLVATQPQWSATHLDPMRDGTFDLAAEFNLAVLAWSPLARGAIATGDGLNEELLSTLDRIAEAHDVDRATVGLAFALAHPVNITVLIGTQTSGRIGDSMKALDVQLRRDEIYAIVQASDRVPLP